MYAKIALWKILPKTKLGVEVMIDFYELLGIKRQATKEEIKSAYRTMVKKYHPDVNKSEEANKIILSLNEAKEVLLDDQKRKEYNELLEGISRSKQFSNDKSETYNTKTQEYRNNYADVYVTKWEFFLNYIKHGLDSIFKKYIKSVLVFINFLLFMVLKGICFGIVFLISLANTLVDYLAGLIMLLAVLSLFVLAGETEPDYIPFIPANVEQFLEFSIVAMVLEMLKVFIVEKSYNLFALLQNIEDKIFILILMKI